MGYEDRDVLPVRLREKFCIGGYRVGYQLEKEDNRWINSLQPIQDQALKKFSRDLSGARGKRMRIHIKGATGFHPLNVLGAGMIQLTPQMRILLSIKAVFRKGIDGLAEICRRILGTDPFSGCVFVFRNHRATAIKALMYD